MSSSFKTAKSKFIVIIVSIVLAVGGIGGFLLIFGYDYDYETAMIVKNRVEKAQYLPNLDILAGNDQSVKLTAANVDSTNYVPDMCFGLESYRVISDELAVISGTGVSYDGTIFDIKKEIISILDIVPAFGKWFQLPIFEKIEDRDYSLYYYKFDYDKEFEKISVTRLSRLSGTGVYDSADDSVFATAKWDNMLQFQLMQANYYYNSDNKEVVECSVIDFIKYDGEYYPLVCQYLENVEDTSTTKIQSVIRNEIEIYGHKPDGYLGSVYDLDTQHDGGIQRKILQLNYTDANNVELIKIEQNFDTEYYSNINTTNLAYYLREGDEAIYFIDAWDYYDAENSLEELELGNIFKISRGNLSKEGIIDSFKKTSYARVAMGTGRTMRIKQVCALCYNQINVSGLLVYKCDHNKNQNTISRNSRDVIATSEEFLNEKYQLLPWYVSNALSKFANNVGISSQIVEDYSSAICSEMNSECEFEGNIDAFMTAISKDYVDNVSLVKDVKIMYLTLLSQAKLLLTSEFNKSAVASEIKLENLNEVTSISNNEITVSASADIKSSNLLEKNAKYSLALVLYDEENQINCTLLTNYVVYKGKDLTLTLNGTYDLSNLTYNNKDAKANVNTTLKLGYALLKESKVCNVVCSNYVNANVASATYSNFEKEVNGFDCVCKPGIKNNVFTLSIAGTDVENPKIEIDKLNGSILTMNTGARLCDILPLLKITDNDMVKNISIMHGDVKYNNLVEALVGGENKIVVVDRAGNISTFIFTITLN